MGSTRKRHTSSSTGARTGARATSPSSTERLASAVARAGRERSVPARRRPPSCWCRPPLPGLPLAFARAHDVDPARSMLVGLSPAHRALATALGARLRPRLSSFRTTRAPCTPRLTGSSPERGTDLRRVCRSRPGVPRRIPTAAASCALPRNTRVPFRSRTICQVTPLRFWSTSNSTSTRPFSRLSFSFDVLDLVHAPLTSTSPSFAIPADTAVNANPTTASDRDTSHTQLGADHSATSSSPFSVPGSSTSQAWRWGE